MINGRNKPLPALWLILRAAGGSVSHHWGLAFLSVVTSFAVWFLVQDVENPRVRAVVPAEADQWIQVEAVNVPDGYLVADPPRVRVEVEAREELTGRLQAGDFHATVDVQTLFADGGTIIDGRSNLNVTVESRRDGVRVINVVPSTVQVAIVEAATKELPVTIRETGALPGGYEKVGETTAQPGFVTITGLPQLVESVARVEATVPLSGVKENQFVHEAEVVALTESGNPVTVRLSHERVAVTVTTRQTFSFRIVPLDARTEGFPAPGWRVSNIQVEPSTVSVSGLQSDVASLSALLVEPVDVTNAKGPEPIVRTRRIVAVDNISTDRETVTVRVELAPIQGTTTIVSSVEFTDLPPGLAPEEPGNYSTQVFVSGDIERLASLRAVDFRVTVSLAGATAGTATFEATATGPPDVAIEGVEPVTVRLEGVPAP